MLDEYQEDFITNLEDQVEYEPSPPAEPRRPNPASREFQSARGHYYQAYEQPESAIKNPQGEIGEMLADAGPGFGFLKTFILGVVSILIVVGSFMASFSLGKKIFLPAQTLAIKNDIPFSTNNSSWEISQLEKENKQDNQKLYTNEFDEVNRIKASVQKSFTNTVSQRKIPGAQLTSRPVQQSTQTKVTQKKKAVMSKAEQKLYKVIAGSFTDQDYAGVAARKLKTAGFKTLIYRNQDNMYRVQVGAFSNKRNAQTALTRAINYGYPAFLVFN